MANYRETIDKNFENILSEYIKLLKEIKLPHEVVKTLVDQIFITGGSRRVDAGKLKNTNLLKIWLFAGNNNLVSLQRMMYFLEKCDQVQNRLPKFVKKPKKQIIEEQTSTFLKNSEMSVNPFETYGNEYKAGLGKAKTQEKQYIKDEAARIAATLSEEELRRLAAAHLAAGGKTIVGNKKAIYGDYHHDPSDPTFTLNDEQYKAMMDNPKNAWAKFIANNPSDIKFKPNLLHDQYSAWYGAKNGYRSYMGDFNKDGATDFILADDAGRIKYYNGYGITPSRQAQYVEYNKRNPWTASDDGKPFRDDDVMTFREWVNAQQSTTDAKLLEKLADQNKDLGSRMIKYKPRYKTVAELVKDNLKFKETPEAPTNFEYLLLRAAGNDANKVKAIRKTCNITKLVSLALKPILLKISDGNVELLKNSKALSQYIQKEVQPILNVNRQVKKDEKTKTEITSPYLEFKVQIANAITNGLKTYGVQILQQCYVGTPEESIMTFIYNEFAKTEVATKLAQTFEYAKAVRDETKAAWRTAHPMTERIGKTIATNRNSGKKSYKPSEADGAMEISDDDEI